MLEIRVTLRMVVMSLVGRRAPGVGRAEFQQERSTTRGHESHGNIGTKDERGQQCDAQNIAAAGGTEPGMHHKGRHYARASAVVPVGTVAVGPR